MVHLSVSFSLVLLGALAAFDSFAEGSAAQSLTAQPSAAQFPAAQRTPLPPTWPEILPVSSPASSSEGEILPLPASPVEPVSTPPATNQAPSGPSLPKGWPNDPLFTYQWDMQVTGMPAAWAQLTATGSTGKPLSPNARAINDRLTPVTVAVLDTGYVNSPELAGRVINGYNFVHDPSRTGNGKGRGGNAAGTGEFAYHAEVIANIIAAAHDGRGMAGINPQAKIVQVRVAGTDGLIDPLDLISGLRWAAGLAVAGTPPNPNPAKIINLSLFADFIPLTGCDARIQKALDEVTAKGVLVVAGAANDGKDAGGYSPAGCRNVLTVTSVTQQGRRPSYANWGKSVALAAPGGETGHGIISSSLSGPGGQRSPDGTSFAAPHVSGVASLLLGVRPKLTPAQLRGLLISSATPFPGGQCDLDPLKTCGSGTLNADAALKRALASEVGR